MSKNKKETTFEEILYKIYYFLKNRLRFDDIQAVTFIMSLFLIPISLLFGFIVMQMNSFKIVFYIFMAIDIIVIIYSIVKFIYFKNKRIYFLEKLETKIIEVNDIEGVNNLNYVEFEHFVKEMFVLIGYKSWNTKRSHDKGADVVAEKNNERIVIQVKHSKASVSKRAVYQTEEGKRYYKADKALLITNNDFTDGTRTTAKLFEIDLVDGHDISKFLRDNGSVKIKYKK